MAELPRNAVPLYRKLAYKSKIGFGKFSDYTVQDLFTINCEDYLVWAYYSRSNFSLIDEIVDRLGIQKIDKPGTNMELLEAYNKQRAHEKFDDMTQEEYMHYRMKQNQASKRYFKERAREVTQRTRMSRHEMQQINHGKKNW